jgi:hypothetical protein
MSQKLIQQFRQQEAESIATMTVLNQWSQLLISVMIREQESKLLATNQPVEQALDNLGEQTK